MTLTARRAATPTSLASAALALTAPLAITCALTREASAHYCRFKKPDERNLCLAQKELSAYFCRYIQSPDTRALCYAWLNGNPARCASIAEAAQKATCEAESRARGEEMRRAQEAAQRAAQGAAQGAAPARGR